MYRTGDILVVDDEINIVDLITEVLSEEGYSVRQAHDGTSALVEIQSQLPAMILLDLSMPDMIGTTLLQKLRSSGISDVPVIIMTAGSYNAETLVAQGATDYLAKPFELDELLSCVARYAQPQQSGASSPLS
jgi:DNA-binding response OmpR family regulator